MCGQGHEQPCHIASILLLLFKQRLKHQHAFVLRMFQIRNLSLKLQLSARSRREKVVDAKKSGKPGLTYKVVPHIDQAAMFGAVYNNLKNGGCIGIFPEGSCV